MKRSLWLLGLTLPVLALAHGGVDAAKRSVEASMLVTGEIAVNPDGSVYGYSLDQRDKLPAVVIKLINETVAGWKFTPVEAHGKPPLAKALMSLRVVAHQSSPGHFFAGIEGATFGIDAEEGRPFSACAQGACLTYHTRQSPDYPSDLAREGVSGTVYVEVEVNRQGHVADAAVRQINLRALGDSTQLARWRSDFERATMSVVRRWTFNVPTTGEGAKQSQWFVIVPVNYALTAYAQKLASDYGRWDAYVPGPVQMLPWAGQGAPGSLTNGGADATPDTGEPFMEDPRFVLLTRLGDGAGKQSGS
jgi:TonB family protein